METGLFFGSFNPVHIGHMIIANYMLEFAGLSEVWFIVSPVNPLKEIHELAEARDRLNMVKMAIGSHPKMKGSDVEFQLPKPSYTVHTLSYLQSEYPGKNFNLILGGDNLSTFHKWKDYMDIISKHRLHVYRRPDWEPGPLEFHPNVKLYHAPVLDISATYIRKCIRLGKSIQYLVPDPVFNYLQSRPIYKH